MECHPFADFFDRLGPLHNCVERPFSIENCAIIWSEMGKVNEYPKQ